MKRIGLLLIAVFVAIVILTPGTAFAKKDNLKLNAENSKLEWLGKKVTGEHSGTINVKSGSFVIDEGEIVEGSFVVDMTSIVNTDIEDEGYKTKLEGHLKSDDFFGVEKFPESKFEITKATKMDDGNYKVKGNITIKGITEQVEFMINLHKHDATVHVSGKMTIDRTKFNVRYGSGSFFENLGDKTIYDDFELNLDLYLE
ncbi:MAG: lipid-binding protein [Bacteroidales bacterium]|nr:MAG: lipid-binding protein [Bacteroidales bacterium]